MTLEMTGERFLKSMNSKIALEHWHRYFLLAELARGRDVLDIASGEGYGADYLARSARSVVGVDASQEAIEHARSRYSAANLQFKQGTVQAIPIGDSSVDIVVSFETIEHVDSQAQQAFFAEIKRVLRPAGTLVISTPDKVVYSDARNYSNPYHVRELDRAEFTGLLESSFERVEIVEQRAGQFSLISAGPPQASYSITRDAIGEYVSGSQPLTFEYLVALCAVDGASPQVTLQSSVAFDEELLGSVEDAQTRQLIAAQAVSEQRAQTIAELALQVQDAQATAQQRAQEVATLHVELVSARALAEQRATEIASLTIGLLEARALNEQRAAELHRLSIAHLDSSAVAEQRAVELQQLHASLSTSALLARDYSAQSQRLRSELETLQQRYAAAEGVLRVMRRLRKRWRIVNGK